MKTKIFAAFVAAMMTITMSASNKENKTNAPQSDNVLPGVTVVATANQRTLVVDDMKYEFNLDGSGRVSTKVAYKKDKKNDWTPISAYSVFYGEEETILTFAKYNPYTKVFNYKPQQTRYNAQEYPEIIRVPQVK